MKPAATWADYVGFGLAALRWMNGANIQAQLVWLNQLIMQIAQTACNFQVVRVSTVWLNPDNFDEIAKT